MKKGLDSRVGPLFFFVVINIFAIFALIEETPQII